MCLGCADRICCSAEKAKLEKTHASALKRSEEEVASLKSQLADITEAHKTEMEQAASEKTRLEEDLKKIRDAAGTTEKKAEIAEAAAGRFQAWIDAWTAEFRKVQDNMHGELSKLTLFESCRVINFRISN